MSEIYRTACNYCESFSILEQRLIFVFFFSFIGRKIFVFVNRLLALEKNISRTSTFHRRYWLRALDVINDSNNRFFFKKLVSRIATSLPMDCRAGSKFVTFFFLKNNLVFVICLLESER